MSMKAIKDLYSTLVSLAPAARTATVNGSNVDLSSAIENEIVVIPGAWTDGTHTFTVQDSADGATFANAAAADLVGTLNPISSTPTAAVSKCSYIGSKRYLRVIVTIAGATTGAVYAVIVQIKPHKQPAP